MYSKHFKTKKKYINKIKTFSPFKAIKICVKFIKLDKNKKKSSKRSKVIIKI